MAASEHLNKTLFHGTGGHIIGDVIHPNDAPKGYGAFATANYGMAQWFASSGAKHEGRLFGTVYEVSPRSKLEQVGDDWDEEYLDTEGLKVQRAHSYPLSEDLYRPAHVTEGGVVILPEENWWDPPVKKVPRKTNKFNLPVGEPED